MNRTVAAFIVCMLPTLSLAADPGFVSAKSGLNIREKADPKAKVVGLVPYQALIEVEEITSIREKIDGIEAPWMKVTYYYSDTDATIQGYAFGGYIFTEKGAVPATLREQFILRTHNLVVQHDKKDDTHWKVSLRLKNGKLAVIFENNGTEDKGSDDLYPQDYFPENSLVFFRHAGLPDSYLVDQITGKVTSLEYGSPAVSPKGTAVYDIATGGMFGVNITIYDLQGRALVKNFSLNDSEAETWDRFRCSWKDELSIDCRYAKNSAEKRFQIRKTGGKWVRSGG